MPARKATSRGAGSAGKATTWRQTSRGGASTTTVVLTGRISGPAGAPASMPISAGRTRTVAQSVCADAGTAQARDWIPWPTIEPSTASGRMSGSAITRQIAPSRATASTPTPTSATDARLTLMQSSSGRGSFAP